MTGTFSVDGGAVTSDVAKTDYEVMIPLAPPTYSTGTWTQARAGQYYLTATRTGANTTEYYSVAIPVPSRSTALKGIKLKAVTVVLTLSGTLNTTDDDLEIDIIKVTMPADGSLPTGAILAGDDNTNDYAAAYNTKAKRLVAGSHNITVTIPTAEQAYLATGEQLYVSVKVKDNANADLVIVLAAMHATFDYNTL